MLAVVFNKMLCLGLWSGGTLYILSVQEPLSLLWKNLHRMHEEELERGPKASSLVLSKPKRAKENRMKGGAILFGNHL